MKLDQSNIGSFDYLLDALSSCPKLQRVYLSIANNTDKLMEGTVMTFLKRTNKLLFFCACLRKTLFNSQLQSQVNNWVRKRTISCRCPRCPSDGDGEEPFQGLSTVLSEGQILLQLLEGNPLECFDLGSVVT
uniref:Uncharacterized protein n=1 Tax=Timema shepardi TaxID=629360 RepID=A0A7R9BAS9_TIMSH|nr:unnamed protein product [Timema shepardi]